MWSGLGMRLLPSTEGGGGGVVRPGNEATP